MRKKTSYPLFIHNTIEYITSSIKTALPWIGRMLIFARKNYTFLLTLTVGSFLFCLSLIIAYRNYSAQRKFSMMKLTPTGPFADGSAGQSAYLEDSWRDGRLPPSSNVLTLRPNYVPTTRRAAYQKSFAWHDTDYEESLKKLEEIAKRTREIATNEAHPMYIILMLAGTMSDFNEQIKFCDPAIELFVARSAQGEDKQFILNKAIETYNIVIVEKMYGKFEELVPQHIREGIEEGRSKLIRARM